MRATILKDLKAYAAVFLLWLCYLPVVSWAQPAHPSRVQTRPSPSLAQAQQAKVKAILTAYEVSSLTAAQARAIHTAFREAGLRGGPALNQAVTDAGFDPEQLRRLDPPPEVADQARGSRVNPREGVISHRRGSQKYSIEQAISDNAQLHTIAFSGLAFLTGDFGASTFIPPGKVCDYFGFQYMRDIDVAEKGHNPMFLNRVAGNVLHILHDEQKQLFLDLAEEQAPQLEKLARMRLPLIKAFHWQLEGDIPSGSAGLNREAVRQYAGELFAYDAELSWARAQVMAQVFLSLTEQQRVTLAQMKFGDFNTWPDIDERGQLQRQRGGKAKLLNVATMTYASEFFSWTAGSVEADTYFCPERHGTYFGGFYMKDIPAMGKRDYDISTSVTGDNGRTFLEEVLTPAQRALITALPDRQRDLLYEIVTVRRTIAQELRKRLKGETPDRAKVLELGRRYGQLDGDLSWSYAMAFARINQTLTKSQRAALEKLRNLYDYVSAPYYLYSSPASSHPMLGNTDSFFFKPKGVVQ